MTAPELSGLLSRELSGVKALTLDFAECDYVSSAGLRVLLASQKIMNRQGSMKVVNVDKTIMEIFEVTGFTEILTIE